MEIITIDGMVEHDFRHSIEDMLRLDQVDEAIERLRDLLGACSGHHEVLPPRFLEVSSSNVEIVGWHRLANRLLDHDRPGHPISAIGVTLADARALGGPGPSRGRLAPFIKTFYFSDDAYPFSAATRDDLLDGYTRDGFEWQGDYQATDATLSIRGIDDLYGAIVELEDRLFANPNPAEEEIRAGTIGACYLAVLIHQSLRKTIREKGLPRPLCILAACDGVYPFFDAPVAGSDECVAEEPAEATPEMWPEELDGVSPADEEELAEALPGEASLLTLVSRKGIKAPVIVLGEEDAREAARYSEMAAAQRLGIDDEHALKGLLEAVHGAALADAAAMGGGAAWGEPDWLDQRAEPDESLAIATESRCKPLPGIDVPGDVQGDPCEHGLWDENDRTAAEISDVPDFPADFPVVLDDPVATDAELAKVPFTAPASHSLRARIRLAQPDSNDTLPDRMSAIVNWIKRLIHLPH